MGLRGGGCIKELLTFVIGGTVVIGGCAGLAVGGRQAAERLGIAHAHTPVASAPTESATCLSARTALQNASIDKRTYNELAQSTLKGIGHVTLLRDAARGRGDQIDARNMEELRRQGLIDYQDYLQQAEQQQVAITRSQMEVSQNCR